jgi:hypothetical protein
MQGAATFVKKLLSNFSDYDFYLNESMDFEAGIAIGFYKEDGITPFFYFFRDGVVLCYPGFGKNVSNEAQVPAAMAQKQGFVV